MKSLIEQGKLLSLSAGARVSNRLPHLVEVRWALNAGLQGLHQPVTVHPFADNALEDSGPYSLRSATNGSTRVARRAGR